MFYWFWKENLDKLPKKISPKRDIILIMIGAWILWIVYRVVDDILGDWCYGLEYLLYILIFNTVFVYKKKSFLRHEHVVEIRKDEKTYPVLPSWVLTHHIQKWESDKWRKRQQ